MKDKCDWIVIEMSGHYHCQRCGDRTPAPTTMMCFSMLSAMMMAYFEDHKKCKAKESGDGNRHSSMQEAPKP